MILLEFYFLTWKGLEPGNPKWYEVAFWITSLVATLFAIYWSYKTARDTFNEEKILREKEKLELANMERSIFVGYLIELKNQINFQIEAINTYISTTGPNPNLALSSVIRPIYMGNFDLKLLFIARPDRRQEFQNIMISMASLTNLPDILQSNFNQYLLERNEISKTIGDINALPNSIYNEFKSHFADNKTSQIVRDERYDPFTIPFHSKIEELTNLIKNPEFQFVGSESLILKEIIYPLIQISTKNPYSHSFINKVFSTVSNIKIAMERREELKVSHHNFLRSANENFRNVINDINSYLN